jgi:hypothetical protein
MNALAFGVRPPRNDDERFLLSRQVLLARQQLLGLGVISTGVALIIAFTFYSMAPWPLLTIWLVLAGFGLIATISALRLRRKKTRRATPTGRPSGCCDGS